MHQVSVIVPIYNAAAHLKGCIQSLIEQSYSALQIILIDDGSTDGSKRIAQEMQAIDSRISLYSQPNQGQSVARNLGLQYATGEWVSFVDADDYLDRDYYQQLTQAINHHDCVQIGYKRVNTQGDILYDKKPRNFYQFTSPCMRLYRRQLFTPQLRFPEGMIYEDVIFSIDFWATRPSYVLLNYAGYNYVEHSTSTTSQPHRQAEKKVFKELFHRLRHHKSIKIKAIILYTLIRLKLHFLKL